MKAPRLTDEFVERKLAEAAESLARIDKSYRRGILSREAGQQELLKVFQDVLLCALSEHHLGLRLNETNYPRFVRAFAEYQKGNAPADTAPLPWLYELSGEPSAAVENDQKQFFRLMETLHLPPEYFAPIADGVPAPDIVPIHLYHSAAVYGTRFRCVDDGGLLADGAPLGKTFTLENDMGLKARLRIKEDRRRGDRNGMDFDELVCSSEKDLVVVKAEFLSEGCIEGYTAKESRTKPEVLIRLKDGGSQVFWLAYWADANDMAAHTAHPLWQAYHRCCAEKQRRQDEILAALFADLIARETGQ